MDCFNHSCPFRSNETSNAQRCECLACPNRCGRSVLISSYRTLTGDELAKINDELAKINAERANDAGYGVGICC